MQLIPTTFLSDIMWSKTFDNGFYHVSYFYIILIGYQDNLAFDLSSNDIVK